MGKILLLSKLLYKYYGRKPIILIDEYDTPIQEAYFSGYWDEMIKFMRSCDSVNMLFHTLVHRFLNNDTK